MASARTSLEDNVPASIAIAEDVMRLQFGLQRLCSRPASQSATVEAFPDLEPACCWLVAGGIAALSGSGLYQINLVHRISTLCKSFLDNELTGLAVIAFDKTAIKQQCSCVMDQRWATADHGAIVFRRKRGKIIIAEQLP